MTFDGDSTIRLTLSGGDRQVVVGFERHYAGEPVCMWLVRAGASTKKDFFLYNLKGISTFFSADRCVEGRRTGLIDSGQSAAVPLDVWRTLHAATTDRRNLHRNDVDSNCKNEKQNVN